MPLMWTSMLIFLIIVMLILTSFLYFFFILPSNLHYNEIYYHSDLKLINKKIFWNWMLW